MRQLRAVSDNDDVQFLMLAYLGKGAAPSNSKVIRSSGWQLRIAILHELAAPCPLVSSGWARSASVPIIKIGRGIFQTLQQESRRDRHRAGFVEPGDCRLPDGGVAPSD
jgi:hypothetical protein